MSGSMIGSRQIQVPNVTGAKIESEISQNLPETMVLENSEQTMVLSQQEETVVLEQENGTGFRKEKDLVIVHGEDIF